MKNRKWVLGILMFLIVVTLAFLVFVMAVGSSMYKKEQTYFTEFENAACDYVQDENVTKEIWENYQKWHKIYITTLVANKYIEGDSTNPVTKVKAKDNEKGYVEIEYSKNKVTCKYKED